MGKPWPGENTTIRFGTYGHFPLQRTLYLSAKSVATHMHVIGVSGSGKSRFLAHVYLSLIRAGLSATLIDPHGDLARLVLSHLVADGVYRKPEAYERLIYLDLPAAARGGKYLPFNVLSQEQEPHSVASNVMEAMHRAWPALAGGNAATFDTLVQNGVKVLLSNKLPLVRLYNLLTDKEYRDQLLSHEDDPDVASVFRNWYDKLSARDQADQAGATLRRVNLLAFDPVLKFSLGQSENRLNFREILDQNRSVIINLAINNGEARRLLGSLLTVQAEQGALSRADLPPDQRQTTHHLLIDEFSEFTAQSEQALSRMLSLTRKYGLYLVMAHQTWSQASDRLRGALQNVGIEVAFRLGRTDAEHSATILGHVDPLTVKHTVEDEHAIDRTHPVFYSLPEQWESWVSALQELPPRYAYTAIYGHRRHPLFPWKHSSRRVLKLKTPAMPDPHLATDQLAEVEAEYLARYFRSQAEISQELPQVRQPPAIATTRIEPPTTAPTTERIEATGATPPTRREPRSKERKGRRQPATKTRRVPTTLKGNPTSVIFPRSS